MYNKKMVVLMALTLFGSVLSASGVFAEDTILKKESGMDSIYEARNQNDDYLEPFTGDPDFKKNTVTAIVEPKIAEGNPLPRRDCRDEIENQGRDIRPFQGRTGYACPPGYGCDWHGGRLSLTCEWGKTPRGEFYDNPTRTTIAELSDPCGQIECGNNDFGG